MSEIVKSIGLGALTVSLWFVASPLLNDTRNTNETDNSKKEQIDVLAIPTHGRRGLSHFFIGSIGEDVANHSKIPVVTFKI